MISVIVTNYNHGEFVIDAYKSLLKQTLKPDEIIIVDDCSTDSSVEVIKNFLSSKKLDIETRLILRDKNGGSAAARNEGIQNAQGDIIALLDGDDIYYKDKLEKSVAILRQYPLVGMVYSDYDGWDFDNKKLEREYKPAYDQRILRQTCVANTNSVFRKATFERAGLFNEEIRGGEDYEMWIRLSQFFILYHIPESLFAYRMHGKNMTILNRDQVIANTNRILKEVNDVNRTG